MSARRRGHAGALVAACCTAAAVVAPAGVVTAAQARTAASAHVETMLVFLRPSTSFMGVASGGRSRERVQQADVASLVEGLGRTVLARTDVPDTLTVRLTATDARALSANPLVAQVLPDVTIPGPPLTAAAAQPLAGATTTGHVTTHASCGTGAHPQLNPEALRNVAAPGAWAAGATGKGVTVAFLADGLDITNPDLRRNAAYASSASHAGTHVITSYQDFSGDGTSLATGGAEAFGDAASIAAQGNVVYDLSRYVSRAHPLPRGCDIRVVGTAPGATLLALKVYSQNNLTTGSGFVQAISYAVAHGAKVINESFGGNGFPDTATDIIRAADDAAVAAGVTVVASAGDAGISSTIGSPATDPNVLAVGATTTFRAYQQDSFGGINAPGSDGSYVDNNISSISSGGFAQDGKTVNLVAPGDLGWALCSSNRALYPECSGQNLQDFGGTSQASPLTAGAAADVIQAYQATHHGAFPTPDLVMRILTSTARDIHAPADQQGAGLLDVAAAVAMARSITGTVARPAGGLLASTPQVDLAGAPRSVVKQTITLTNTGATASVVKLATRALVPVGTHAGTVVLDPSVHTKQPKFPIWSGVPEIYQKATFKVPAGISRVKLAAAFHDTGQSSLLHVALFDPHGTFEGYSLPQGQGDFADVEVATPVPGAWTAVFFTVWNGYGHGQTGTSGPVRWSATFWRYVSSGTVGAPALAIAPGHTAAFLLRVVLAPSPGDASLSISVTAHGTAATIPVTLRTFIPITANGGTYSGVLTGGNGRGGAPGQTDTYSFTVPAGKTDLDASVVMSKNPGAGLVPGDQVIGMLVDPSGQVDAYDSNYTSGPGFSGYVSRYLNLYKANPAPGAWELVLEWVQPGAGVATSIPFDGAIRFNQVSTQSSLPDSTSATVSASSGADFAVKVSNDGVAPMILSPDPRLPTTVPVPLTDVYGDAATQSFGHASNAYYVPTETSSLTVTVAATVPATFDVSTYTGDPDLSPTIAAPYVSGSVTASLATMTYAPPSGVGSGIWGVVPAEVGPYGTGAEPAGTETTTATAMTLDFDPSITSTVPDTVESLTTETGAINPDFVSPGTWDLISLHIAPTASVGSVASGTLFITGLATGSVLGNSLVNAALFTNDLAAIPYEYTVAP